MPGRFGSVVILIMCQLPFCLARLTLSDDRANLMQRALIEDFAPAKHRDRFDVAGFDDVLDRIRIRTTSYAVTSNIDPLNARLCEVSKKD